MQINFNDILYAFSYGLDCVEHELVGATTHHAKRVAYLCGIMGRMLGMLDDDLLDLTAAAVLHDCALTEYLKAEQGIGHDLRNPEILGIHCSLGQNNVAELPFQGDITGAILYHHERPDGMGPFGMESAGTPLFAQLIHFGDCLDVSCNLGLATEENFNRICEFVAAGKGTTFVEDQAELFLKLFDQEMLRSIAGNGVERLLKEDMPQRMLEQEQANLYSMGEFFARIIDYKSEFTGMHSRGIAQKAFRMGQYYGWENEKLERLYLAAALHDVGKLAVGNDILEKPGKLDAEEYSRMQNHAVYTYRILSQIQGFEEITSWASRHHEKLNGTGYPFRLTGDELSREERLLACLDIYQALSESRPYKDGMPHEKVMRILSEMAERNDIDGDIVQDIGNVFQEK